MAFGAFSVWVFGMGDPFKRIVFDTGTGLLAMATITDTGVLAIGGIGNVTSWYQPFSGKLALAIASIVLVILLKEKK